MLPSDFQLNIYNNDGNADTARITDITSSDGSSLDPGGGDSLILINRRKIMWVAIAAVAVIWYMTQ